MSQSYNKGGWIVFISCLCFSVVWVLYFMIFSVPVDLDEVADIPVPIVKNIDISQVQDYWIESELMVQKGAQIYSTYCALCHGVRGKGDGIAGKSLKPPTS